LSKFSQEWYNLEQEIGVVTLRENSKQFRNGKPKITTPSFDAIDLTSSKFKIFNSSVTAYLSHDITTVLPERRMSRLLE